MPARCVDRATKAPLTDARYRYFSYSYPYSPSRRQIWFEKVAGVLRIAHKYEDRELHQRALLILSEAFCATPDGSLSVCVRNSYLIEDRDLEDACVLAHKVGAFWLLPNIYFRAIVARAQFKNVGLRGLQKWSAADLKEDMIASLMYKLTWRLPRQCMNHHDQCADDHDRCTRSLRLYHQEIEPHVITLRGKRDHISCSNKPGL